MLCNSSTPQCYGPSAELEWNKTVFYCYAEFFKCLCDWCSYCKMLLIYFAFFHLTVGPNELRKLICCHGDSHGSSTEYSCRLGLMNWPHKKQHDKAFFYSDLIYKTCNVIKTHSHTHTSPGSSSSVCLL